MPENTTATNARIGLAVLAMALAAPAFAVIPPAPPGTTATTQSFSNSTLVAIPASGTPTVSSTIQVSGLSGTLWDVDLNTLIRHAVTYELQITVTSPAGTVITLASNVFNDGDDSYPYADVLAGTLWDDQANPGGAVPYVTNPGSGTDHPFVSGTTATPLTPTEGLSALRGENPNGTWTLTIADRFDGGGGSLDTWSLTLATLPSAPTTASIGGSNATAVPIPATGAPTITSQIGIFGGTGVIVDLNVRTFIPHTNSADLDMTLTSPSGTVVTLTSDSGAVFNDVYNGTVFDDDANTGGTVPYSPDPFNTGLGVNAGLTTDHPYNGNGVVPTLAPEEPLGAFSGEDPNGTWTLTISDDRDAGGGGGTLTSWSLDIAVAGGGGPTPPPLPYTIPSLGWSGLLLLAIALGLAGVRARSRA